jgi:hypothetical protein
MDVIVRKYVDIFMTSPYSKQFVLKSGCLRFLLYVMCDIVVLTYCLLVIDISTANCVFYLTKKSSQPEDGL